MCVVILFFVLQMCIVSYMFAALHTTFWISLQCTCRHFTVSPRQTLTSSSEPKSLCLNQDTEWSSDLHSAIKHSLMKSSVHSRWVWKESPAYVPFQAKVWNLSLRHPLPKAVYKAHLSKRSVEEERNQLHGWSCKTTLNIWVHPWGIPYTRKGWKGLTWAWG